MAAQVTLAYSSESLLTLDTIWLWNAEHFSPDHADAYLAFLRAETQTLLTVPDHNRTVTARPQLRYKLLQKRPHRHGHLVVYQRTPTTLRVVDFFHTAQDWQAALSNR